jgi:hypothetical protein
MSYQRLFPALRVHVGVKNALRASLRFFLEAVPQFPRSGDVLRDDAEGTLPCADGEAARACVAVCEDPDATGRGAVVPGVAVRGTIAGLAGDRCSEWGFTDAGAASGFGVGVSAGEGSARIACTSSLFMCMERKGAELF